MLGTDRLVINGIVHGGRPCPSCATTLCPDCDAQRLHTQGWVRGAVVQACDSCGFALGESERIVLLRDSAGVKLLHRCDLDTAIAGVPWRSYGELVQRAAAVRFAVVSSTGVCAGDCETLVRWAVDDGLIGAAEAASLFPWMPARSASLSS
jgi:hypothetical protein